MKGCPATEFHAAASMNHALFVIAEVMGAKPVALIFAGLSAQKQKAARSDKMVRRAQEAGRKLIVH
jgi:hypothetical protein